MKFVAYLLLLGIAATACKRPNPEQRKGDNTRGQLEAQRAMAAAKAQAEREKQFGRQPTKVIGPTKLNVQPLGPVPVPEGNPQSPEKIELGHVLFFDKRLSADNSRACYTCHQNEDGTGGHDPTAIGAKKKELTRHTPIIWNVGYQKKLYWDGRAETLEEQALGAWGGGNMGVGKENLEKKAKEIGKIAGYKKLFEKAFPGKGATPETVSQALASYERTLVCDDTAFDRFTKGNREALDAEQKKGLDLFMGKAGCATCHAPPYFSIAYISKSSAFFNAGVGIDGKKEEDVDVGRMTVTKDERDWAAFKPPTLRNVAKSLPYFHDGSGKTLEQAVRFMAGGGFKNKNLTGLLTDKKLNDAEIASIVSFLKALDCPGSLETPAKMP